MNDITLKHINAIGDFLTNEWQKADTKLVKTKAYKVANFYDDKKVYQAVKQTKASYYRNNKFSKHYKPLLKALKNNPDLLVKKYKELLKLNNLELIENTAKAPNAELIKELARKYVVFKNNKYQISNKTALVREINQNGINTTIFLLKADTPSSELVLGDVKLGITQVRAKAGELIKELGLDSANTLNDVFETFATAEIAMATILADTRQQTTTDKLETSEVFTAPSPIIDTSEIEQPTLFANIAMGVDTAEITSRHQFFSPMFRGIAELGEQGLYDEAQKAKSRNRAITIPYKTNGRGSSYSVTLETSANISGTPYNLLESKPEAMRYNARIIKTLGIFYLWAMHTNSLTIANTEVSEMLKLAGYEGRIKSEHYIDVTIGTFGLFSTVISRTAKTYTDPKTGRVIRVGKNEIYGEVIRPVGSVYAVFHKSKNGEPLYIKKIIRLKIAEGMLNPEQKRATLLSKALLQLNTLQERQYIILGSNISDKFSQFQDATIAGKPIRLKLGTLLEWRGLANTDDLARNKRTKDTLKTSLDKLIEIGHIKSWRVHKANYNDIKLSGKGLDTIILIEATEAIRDTLKADTIANQDSELINMVKREVNQEGKGLVASHYGIETNELTALINGKMTAKELPVTAYDKLKVKYFDTYHKNNKVKV